jgi:hypothetical protein
MTSIDERQSSEVNPCVQLPLLTGEVVNAMQIFRQTKNIKLDQAAQWIQRALNLERAHERWVTEAAKLLEEGRMLLNSNEPLRMNLACMAEEQSDIIGEKKYGGKRRAEVCRSAYIRREESRGNPIKSDRLRGPYYRNGRDLLIGLTFSSDLGKRWWVNFKKECDEVVVLCDGKAESVQVVYLTQPFFEEHRRHFQAGDDGLIQITLRMRDGRFFAQVPSLGQIDIMPYLDREPLICKRHDENEFV